MKQFILVITIGLFAFINDAQAQLTPTQAHRQALQLEQKNRGPQMTKGYYAIGNNSKKLFRNNEQTTASVETHRRDVKKGFYNIAGQQAKLAPQLQPVEMTDGKRNVQKGYYSIAGNAAKL